VAVLLALDLAAAVAGAALRRFLLGLAAVAPLAIAIEIDDLSHGRLLPAARDVR
jgi:hypothetical protein